MLDDPPKPSTPDFAFQGFLEISKSLFAVSSPDGRFLWLSDGWATTLGYENADLLDVPFIKWVHSDDVQATIDATKDLSNGGRVVGFENRYRHKDGSWRWLYWNAGLRADGFIYAVALDVTERRERMRKLEEKSRLLKLSEELAGVGHWHINLNEDNPELFWSDQVFAIHGRDRHGYTPRLEDGISAYHPDDQAEVSAHVERAIANREDFNFDKLRLVRADTGDIRYVASRGRVTEDRGEISIFGVFQDVTDTCQKERERDTLLQEVHHRVKNNLQVISSLIRMQSRKLDAGVAKDALEQCGSRVETIALIHEKLYASQDYGQVDLKEYASGLLHNIFEVSDRRNPHKDSLQLCIEHVSLPVDKAIPCGLILNELITNAMKHGFPDGDFPRIIVTVKESEGVVTLQVKDNGRGLPEGFAPGRSETLGVQLISTLTQQLDGMVNFANDGGACITVVFRSTDEGTDRYTSEASQR